MTTLHEEQPTLPRKHSLDLLSTDTIEEEEGQEDKPEMTVIIHSSPCQSFNKLFQDTYKYNKSTRRIPTSRTLDSLMELAPKSSTPSGSSSGYGSQAVSSTNLSSDDSMSLKSISVDETPDLESKTCVSNDLQPVTEVADAPSDIHTSDDQEDYANTSINEDNSSDDCLQNGVDNPIQAEHNNEESSLTKTHLSPGKVVRRKRNSNKSHHVRASFPQARPQLSESKQAQSLEQNMMIISNLSHDEDGMDSSSDRLEEDFGSKPDLTKLSDVPVPDWVVLGESVLIRPYNSSGVVAYIGGTEFASGTWIGVDLDAPKGNKEKFTSFLYKLLNLGKNDGSVQGIRYFSSRPKYGMFVRADKLILDRRGRAMRAYKAESLANNNKCASGRGNTMFFYCFVC